MKEFFLKLLKLLNINFKPKTKFIIHTIPRVDNDKFLFLNKLQDINPKNQKVWPEAKKFEDRQRKKLKSKESKITRF